MVIYKDYMLNGTFQDLDEVIKLDYPEWYAFQILNIKEEYIIQHSTRSRFESLALEMGGQSEDRPGGSGLENRVP